MECCKKGMPLVASVAAGTSTWSLLFAARAAISPEEVQARNEARGIAMRGAGGQVREEQFK
jgi:hypothetical protein